MTATTAASPCLCTPPPHPPTHPPYPSHSTPSARPAPPARLLPRSRRRLHTSPPCPRLSLPSPSTRLAARPDKTAPGSIPGGVIVRTTPPASQPPYPPMARPGPAHTSQGIRSHPGPTMGRKPSPAPAPAACGAEKDSRSRSGPGPGPRRRPGPPDQPARGCGGMARRPPPCPEPPPPPPLRHARRPASGPPPPARSASGPRAPETRCPAGRRGARTARSRNGRRAAARDGPARPARDVLSRRTPCLQCDEKKRRNEGGEKVRKREREREREREKEKERERMRERTSVKLNACLHHTATQKSTPRREGSRALGRKERERKENTD